MAVQEVVKDAIAKTAELSVEVLLEYGAEEEEW